jgi:hypothetical protein
MNEDLKISRIVEFVKDETTMNAVYEVLRDSFLTGKGQRDIQMLAAERLAIDLLDNAWRDLQKYKVDDKSSSPSLKQVGL